jgi:hypothetical protein
MQMSQSSAIILLLAIASTNPTPADGANAASNGAVGIDLEAMKSLEPGERCAIVLAILDARDRSLENIDYCLTQTTTNIRQSDGRRRHLGTNWYDVRRLRDTLWMHVISHDSADGKITSEGINNWDGKVKRGLAFPPYAKAPYYEGVVEARESANFSRLKYNEILGIRMSLPGSPSVRGWLRDVLRSNERFQVSADVIDAKQVLRIDVVHDPLYVSFWLDPRCGFMTIRTSYRVGGEESVNRSTLVVTGTEQTSGVWVPKHVVENTSNSIYPERSEVVYDIEKVSIGTVTPADVDVPFPLGTRVIDKMQNIAYFVRPNQKYELIPLADSRTRTINAPPENALVESVGPKAARLYSTKPLRVSAPAPPARWSRGRTLWLAGSLLLVVGTFIGYLRGKRFRAYTAKI